MLLFTSGSSGDPKGVVLSHRNIVGNVAQFRVVLDATKEDLMLASLPFFHSFGCTVTLWFPLIDGVRIVTYPNPLEAGKCAEIIGRYRVTVVLAAPTFLRGYLRKAEREQFESVRLTITGAEKLPRSLAEAFEERIGQPVFEGYGLTETSPVVSVNLPNPDPSLAGEDIQPSNRPGSVGKMVPGLAAEIREPETGKKLSLHDTGMLWLRGSNIFEGYLNDPKRTAEVLQDGWLKTGDLGRFDEDGFLFIEGRLSRFSKIGGEMVPHETVEQRILAALGISNEGARTIAVASAPDEAKGETLVILSTIEIDQAQLREKLQAAGVPNLWIPKVVRRVETIPVLATGKLDLRKCNELAAIGVDFKLAAEGTSSRSFRICGRSLNPITFQDATMNRFTPSRFALLWPMTTTISSRGQTVIPAEIRQRHSLTEQSRLAWIDDGETIRVVPLSAGEKKYGRGRAKGLKLSEALQTNRSRERKRERRQRRS